MTYLTLDYDDRLGERFLQPDAIALSDEAIAWSATHSQTVNPADPWSTYLHLLAWIGVREWLQMRSPRLALPAWDPATLPPHPPTLQIGDAIAHLVAIACLEDGTVEIPRQMVATQDASDSSVCILVEVLDELEQIQVRGFLPQITLMRAIQTANLDLDADDTYSVPVDWFDLDPDRLLLQTDVGTLGAIAAAAPDLTALSRPAINAALWFRDQLDQVAQDLAWMLLPSFSYSPALRSLRSPLEQLDGILSDLTRHRDVTIPTTARSAAHDFCVDEAFLRLYVIIWELPSASDESDWNLLAILSPQPDSLMPLGTCLQIRDDQSLLTETILDQASSTFLYAQVAGVHHEQFLITVRSPNGIHLSLPPIAFMP
ncbi:MAG: DUF1822 family protein [Leptolyngbya sp. DLM2.Bin15]|nr:MAG: DUF1822 family protein [Leptolyngbya sp. DLM2.Bin15]